MSNKFFVSVTTEMSVEDLLHSIGHENVVDFIKKLDEASEDWGITEELYKHFSDLHEEYLKESK
jgi:hypothetical protein